MGAGAQQNFCLKIAAKNRIFFFWREADVGTQDPNKKTSWRSQWGLDHLTPSPRFTCFYQIKVENVVLGEELEPHSPNRSNLIWFLGPTKIICWCLQFIETNTDKSFVGSHKDLFFFQAIVMYRVPFNRACFQCPCHCPCCCCIAQEDMK